MRRRPTYRLVDVAEVPSLFPPITGMAAEAARLRDRHPSEVAAIVRALPPSQRRQLAAAMDDERLADLLEELPEDEQVRLVQGLDFDRLVDVLEEMELDDLADLVGEMPSEQQERILAALDAEEADALQRLLSYEEGTAGGMMTPEVIILSPAATVADALAQIRQPDRVVSIATQVFVCEPPYRPPTGRLLGTAHVQRLLREPPRTGAARLPQPRPRRRAGRHRPRRRRAARQLRHARRRRLRPGRPAARRRHRRRRARPPARHRVA